MSRTYTCPQSKLKDKRWYCSKTKGLCGHVRFCQMEGRWKLTQQALDCPMRKETQDE